MAESSSSSSSLLSTPDSNPNLSRKRRKIQPDHPTRTHTESNPSRWRTESEQQIYSSKLADAIRSLRRRESTSGADVRDAADRVLAASARGKTRWSRAILTRRLSLRLAHVNRKHKKAARSDFRLKKSAAARKNKKVPPLQKKVKVLSRLVPGCRKLPLPTLLEETTDYIAALEMQVKAMAFLTGLLDGGGGDQYFRSS